jgi:hypothetical protein
MRESRDHLMPAATIASYGGNGQKDVCFRLWKQAQISAASNWRGMVESGRERRVAYRRESALRINGGDAVADEHGVVPEYHDRAYGEGGRRTEFKSVAFLNCRHHAR